MSQKLKIMVEITIDNPIGISLPLSQLYLTNLKDYVEDAISQPRLSEKQLKKVKQLGEDFENPPTFAQQMHKLGIYHDAEVVGITVQEEHDVRQ